MACLRDGIKPKDGYSETVRAFSLKLHFFSPKAYEFVRSEFNNHLPHASTIKAWYRNSNLDAKSGINENAMNILKQIVREMKNKDEKLVGSLSFDEMAIRKHYQWCNKTKEFLGNVSYGDSTDVANNAIVFLINGVNTHITLPIAYYFITTLTAEQRKTLLLEILNELFDCGIIISNVTFDGLPANALMCVLLGADLDSEELKPYFIHPKSNQKIYIILDPSHCQKLVRNNLSNYGIILDANDEEIKWEFFSKLVEFGKNNNYNLSHKINKRHIDFHNRPMHVRTAVETLSNSVADSMEFLMNQNIEQFSNANATIKFIRMINSVFDVMNTQRIMNSHTNQLKSAINPRNEVDVFIFLMKAKEYILSLKIKSNSGSNISITKSSIKAGFRGYVLNIVSVMAIYRDYVEEHHIAIMIATYRFSQDHLERFFGKIRSIHRCNDNPTVQQFIASYKKLQLISDFQISDYSNVSNISNVLTISSLRPKRSTSNDTEQNQQNEEIPDVQYPAEIDRFDYLNDKCSNGAIAFVAYKIERRLLDCGQIYCALCEKVLLENEKLDQRDCIGLSIPCRSTFQICKTTDKAVKQYIDTAKENLNNKVIHSVMMSIKFSELYQMYYGPDHDDDHKHSLVRYIINEYIHIKCNYLSKQKTLDMHKKFFRNDNKKKTHFAGL